MNIDQFCKSLIGVNFLLLCNKNTRRINDNKINKSLLNKKCSHSMYFLSQHQEAIFSA